jgi:hypothetical protein
MEVGNEGSHSMQAGDIDSARDIDIVGENYAGKCVVESWRSRTK